MKSIKELMSWILIRTMKWKIHLRVLILNSLRILINSKINNLQSIRCKTCLGHLHLNLKLEINSRNKMTIINKIIFMYIKRENFPLLIIITNFLHRVWPKHHQQHYFNSNRITAISLNITKISRTLMISSWQTCIKMLNLTFWNPVHLRTTKFYME